MADIRPWYLSSLGPCASVEYVSGNTTTTYQGAVIEQSGSDALLALGQISGSSGSSGPSSEFDGWIRQGSVVYATYFLGDPNASLGELETAGRAVAAAAQDKLSRAGA